MALRWRMAVLAMMMRVVLPQELMLHLLLSLLVRLLLLAR
jgi:hypothetical protein